MLITPSTVQTVSLSHLDYFIGPASVNKQAKGTETRSMDIETYLESRHRDRERAPEGSPGRPSRQNGLGDANTLITVKDRAPSGIKASILNGARPRGTQETFEQQVAWARSRQGRVSASDDDFLLHGAMRHISMSIQDATRSK